MKKIQLSLAALAIVFAAASAFNKPTTFDSVWFETNSSGNILDRTHGQIGDPSSLYGCSGVFSPCADAFTTNQATLNSGTGFYELNTAENEGTKIDQVSKN